MALATLAKVKLSLGITDELQDDELKYRIGVASGLIRRECKRVFGGLITEITQASPTVVESLNHGLDTGDKIVVFNSDGDPGIDGEQTITRVDDDHFTVVVDMTADPGTKGNWVRKIENEYHSGDGGQVLQLLHRPVHSISDLRVDNEGYYGQGTDPFASGDALTEGTEFVLVRDDPVQRAVSRSGKVCRISSRWPRPTGHLAGMLSETAGMAMGNIRVTYIAGYGLIPLELQGACATLVGQMNADQESGGAKLSERFGEYSYTRMDAKDEARLMTSVRGQLRLFKSWADRF